MDERGREPESDGADESTPVEETLGGLLTERDETLATAESLTGGLVGSRVTDVPGASAYFDRGFVTYAYDAKRELLGVSREALDEYGAVSETVALEMARRVRDRSDTTWGVSVTGVAGPGGGSEAKPVGTVYLGVAYAGEWGSGESYAAVEHHVFEGDRRSVREQAAERTLEMLLERVEAGPGDDGP